MLGVHNIISCKYVAESLLKGIGDGGLGFCSVGFCSVYLLRGLIYSRVGIKFMQRHEYSN